MSATFRRQVCERKNIDGYITRAIASDKTKSFPLPADRGRKLLRVFAVRDWHSRRALHSVLFAMTIQNKSFRSRIHRRWSEDVRERRRERLHELVREESVREADSTKAKNLNKRSNRRFATLFVLFCSHRKVQHPSFGEKVKIKF